MKALKSAKPANTMLTYILEQSSGVQKINVPGGWKLKVEQGYNNTGNATFSDERGSVRLSFMHVLSIRDTATKMQEALIDRNNDNEVTWSDVESDQALYRHAREAAIQEFSRRNRTNNQTNTGRRAGRVYDEDIALEEPLW